MIRTAREVIDAAHRRGFGVRVKPGPPPMPVLVMPAGSPKNLQDEATEALMGLLAAWRADIIDELTKQEQ